MSSVVRSSDVIDFQQDQTDAQYNRFCLDFLFSIVNGKSLDADALLAANKRTHKVAIEREMPFNEQVESIVGDGLVDKPYVRIVQMGRILENHGVDTDTTRVYHLGGLIALEKTADASQYLLENSCLPDVAAVLLSNYEAQGNSDDPRIALMKTVMGFKPKDPTILDLREALAKV